jgi:hypothetical protein
MALTKVSPSMQSRDFESVTSLLADTVLSYAGTGTEKAVAGNTVVTRSEGFAYKVALQGATDEHVTTAGGVKLYVLPGDVGYNVKAFGAVGDGITDDTATIQDAVYNVGRALSSLGDTEKGINSLYFPAGQYKISKPILFHAVDGLRISGASRLATEIRPTGAMTPVLDATFQALQDTGTFNYDTQNCCFMFAAVRRTGKGDWSTVANNTAQWHVQIQDMAFIGEFANKSTVMGIYSPRIAHSKYSNLFFKYLKHGFSAADMYRSIFEYCDFTDTGNYPIGHNDNQSFVATGTSVTLINCGAYSTYGGFKFSKLFYSTLINCAVDNWASNVVENGTVQTYAYSFNGCTGMTLLSCGCEDGQLTLTKGIFNITGGILSSTTIMQGAYVIKDTGSTGDLCTFAADYVHIDGAIVLLNTQGTKTPTIKVSSGTVKLNNLNQTIALEDLLNITSNTVKVFSDDDSVTISADATNALTLVASTSTVVGFGANKVTPGWGAWNSSTNQFTAPYASKYLIQVKVKTNGSGVDTVQTRKNGASLDIEQMVTTDLNQSYMFSRIIELQKGDVIDVLLTTTGSVSGVIRNRYMNINSEV